MSSSQLPNYLRSSRKRSGLSQDEVAFLLGAQDGAKVCRYEKFMRQPSLETAFACQVIFRMSASELFAGLYQEVKEKIMARARSLAARRDKQEKFHRFPQKSVTLRDIAAGKPSKSKSKA